MLPINQLAWLAEAPVCGVSGSAESEVTAPSGVASGLQAASWHSGEPEPGGFVPNGEKGKHGALTAPGRERRPAESLARPLVGAQLGPAGPPYLLGEEGDTPALAAQLSHRGSQGLLEAVME